MHRYVVLFLLDWSWSRFERLAGIILQCLDCKTLVLDWFWKAIWRNARAPDPRKSVPRLCGVLFSINHNLTLDVFASFWGTSGFHCWIKSAFKSRWNKQWIFAWFLLSILSWVVAPFWERFRVHTSIKNQGWFFIDFKEVLRRVGRRGGALSAAVPPVLLSGV